MDVGAQIAVGGHFEDLADVDDEASGDRRRVDPTAVVILNLQAGLPLLQEKSHEPGILVGAHTLIALAGRAAGVTDDLDEWVWRRRVDRRENVLGLFKRGREGAQHFYGKRRGLILIGEKGLLKLGERRRPLVRTLQTIPRRRLPVEGQRWSFRSDVNLLAPVGFTPSMLVASAVVAPEMWRVHHFDGELVLLGESEEASGDLQNVLNEAIVDPVTDQVEETDIARRGSQIFEETCALREIAFESTKVEGGQRLGVDGDRHNLLPDDR